MGEGLDRLVIICIVAAVIAETVIVLRRIKRGEF